MDNLKIILLNAKAGAGKDTYYNEYKDKNHGINETVKRVAYADAIKNIMVEYFGWDRDNKEGIWRTRMQKIGQYFRDLDKNVWVDYTANDIRTIMLAHDWISKNKSLTIFITDCRFDNEVLRIKELFPQANIVTQRLHREFESGLSNEQQNDISELGISDCLVDEEIYVKTKT